VTLDAALDPLRMNSPPSTSRCSSCILAAALIGGHGPDFPRPLASSRTPPCGRRPQVGLSDAHHIGVARAAQESRGTRVAAAATPSSRRRALVCPPLHLDAPLPRLDGPMLADELPLRPLALMLSLHLRLPPPLCLVRPLPDVMPASQRMSSPFGANGRATRACAFATATTPSDQRRALACPHLHLDAPPPRLDGPMLADEPPLCLVGPLSDVAPASQRMSSPFGANGRATRACAFAAAATPSSLRRELFCPPLHLDACLPRLVGPMMFADELPSRPLALMLSLHLRLPPPLCLVRSLPDVMLASQRMSSPCGAHGRATRACAGATATTPAAQRRALDCPPLHLDAPPPGVGGPVLAE
jgi:hypothetical protein